MDCRSLLMQHARPPMKATYISACKFVTEVPLYVGMIYSTCQMSFGIFSPELPPKEVYGIDNDAVVSDVGKDAEISTSYEVALPLLVKRSKAPAHNEVILLGIPHPPKLVEALYIPVNSLRRTDNLSADSFNLNDITVATVIVLKSQYRPRHIRTRRWFSPFQSMNYTDRR